MNIIRNILKVIFAIFIFQLVFLGVFFLRMKGSSKNNSREIATGRVLWRWIDRRTDTSELLLNGERIAYGAMEIYKNGDLLVGEILPPGTNVFRNFVLDTSMRSTNSIFWLKDGMELYRKFSIHLEPSKYRTLLDCLKSRKNPWCE